MRTRGVFLAAGLALVLAFGGCTDSVVGTDGIQAEPTLKKGDNGGGGGGGKPGGGGDDSVDFRPVNMVFEDAGIASDGAGPYIDGECGVWANIGNFDDARLDPDRDYKGKVAKQCDQRLLVFNFTDGFGQVSKGAFMNIHGLDQLASGQSMITTAQFNLCGTLVYETVLATRDGDEWTVTTEGAGASDLAYCSGRATNNNMAFTVTISEQ